MDRLTAYLHRQTGAWYLAAFRVLFGFILLAEAGRIGTELDGNSPNDLTEMTVLFKYRFFEWVDLLPLPWLEAIQLGMVVTALLVSLGLMYRLSIILYGLGYAYFFLVDMSHFNNHYYLLLLFIGFMAATDPHRVFSLDRRLFRWSSVTVPRWQYILFRFQVVWVYFCAGLVKLNADWLGMHTMRFAMTQGNDYIDQPIFQQDYLIGLYTYGGLAFDLCIGWMLLYNKTRRLAILGLACFHILNSATLSIGIFPFLMLAACLLFFEEKADEATATAPAVPHQRQKWTTAALLLFAGVQLALPGRHHLIPGRVDWTGEGAMFAWRMKASGRSGHTDHFRIYMYDRASGEELKPVINLSDRQVKFLLYRPVLFLQVRDELLSITKRTADETTITADVWCAINGHPYAPLLYPDADLCRIERACLGHNAFITKNWRVLSER